ncbi:hypothetical protein E1265_31415 [Streptomyces sp. 8K308]|uniref:hypothetical protein n=1 Tax=Streptomyces sp. 8K308 TaxID=2530388 RepID=UPI001053BE6C|nr:hypothetical protein [Streptomyces sp. 8K308]TDC10310.1 hypothetical protein E1265_31415 [Streptomyces sp. 8K308]
MTNGGVDSVSAFPVPIHQAEVGRRRTAPVSHVCVRNIKQADGREPARHDLTGRRGIALDYGVNV